MPMEEAPAIENEASIFERLETAKNFGLISEYLLNWRSESVGWSPQVTVWSSAQPESGSVQLEIAAILDGLVGESQIVVLED